MRSVLSMGLLIAASFTAVGCGERNCQSTCQKVYGASECAVSIEGESPEESIDTCLDRCETALQKAGDICVDKGGKEECYDPSRNYPASDPPELENEKWAAAWMDCVWDLAPVDGYSKGCESLQLGTQCAPTR
ncbi:MAG: hypothetical protein ACI8PZ_004885 [Myxococcota bacterium]|jgi:hypothetical protein